MRFWLRGRECGDANIDVKPILDTLQPFLHLIASP